MRVRIIRGDKCFYKTKVAYSGKYEFYFVAKIQSVQVGKYVDI